MEGEGAGDALARGMARNGRGKVSPGRGGQQVHAGTLLLHRVARQCHPLSAPVSPLSDGLADGTEEARVVWGRCLRVVSAR